MSFWNTSDQDNAAKTGADYNMGGGDMEPIPANTRLKAMIEEAHWDERNGEQYINLRWTVLEPETYKNRKVFQKLRVMDQKPEKADKAKRMLAAIDANAGGQLAQQDQAPTDMNLANALINKPMLIEVQVWELVGDDNQTRTGNWVSRVSSASQAQTQQAPAREPGSDDDNIPF
jgi:hypothetical protein